jgi:hypothetical protein
MHNEAEGDLTYKERKFKQTSRKSPNDNGSYRNTLSGDEEDEDHLEEVPDDDGFGDV